MKDPRPVSSSARFLALLRKLFLVFVVMSSVFLIVRNQITQRALWKNLPDHGEAPAFLLIDQEHQTFKTTDMKGKVWVTHFFFTRCGTICPRMVASLKEISGKLSGLRLVSITVDPQFDRPEVLKAYAKKNKMDLKRWTLLSGDSDVIKSAMARFKLASADEPIFHSGSFILIDGQQRIRGYYNSEDPEALHKLRQEAGLLLKFR